MRNHHHTPFSGAEWQPVSPAHPNTVDVRGNCGRFEGYIVTSAQLSGTKKLAQNTTMNRLGNLSTKTKPSDALGLVTLRFVLTRETNHPYMKFEILPEPTFDSTIGQCRQLSSDRMACDSTKACSDLSIPFAFMVARSVDLTNFVMHLHSFERRYSVMKKILWC
jgi:hypothetical protein